MPVEIRHPGAPEDAADFLRTVNTSFLAAGQPGRDEATFWLDQVKPDLQPDLGSVRPRDRVSAACAACRSS